jgi:uncharacterized protein (DUF2267 family)
MQIILEIFGKTIKKTSLWLEELEELIGWADTHKTFLALRSVLHALRDRLAPDEAVHLGAQLPMLIRGFYYEGWKPAGKPLKERHLEEFLAHIQSDFRQVEVDTRKIASSVFTLLSEKISKGEIEDIKGILPHEIQELWPEVP